MVPAGGNPVTAVVRRLLALAALAFVVVGGCATNPVRVPATMQQEVDYLLQLGLLRGHLLVGHALFNLGERGAAHTHAKHPEDELYAGLEAVFAAHGVPGFAAELADHAAAVKDAEADVAAAYERLVTAIARHEAVVAPRPSLAARVIERLLREAAREYAVGIVDGRLANAHEYQDAYGFTQVALATAQATHAALDLDDPDRAVFGRIVGHVAALADMWPNLLPPPRLRRDATRIAATAGLVRGDALRLRVRPRFE